MSTRTAVAARPVVLTRAARLLLALFLATGVVITSLVAGTRPAYAASDQIDNFEITYDVRPSGVVRVVETITYRFGDGSGRHGIDRELVTREPYDDEQDRQMRELVETQIEAESRALFLTARVYDDGIIDPRDTRTVLGMALSVAHNNPVKGRRGFGVFRM